MNNYKSIFNIKLILFLTAILSIVIIFLVNRIIINQLRSEAQLQVQFLAKSYTNAINSNNQDDFRFVIEVLLPSMNFPIVITTANEISAIMNLDIENNIDRNEYIWKVVKKMDENFVPLDLIWNDIKWGEIHYSDPNVITHLIWVPYFEIGFGIIIFLIALWGFQLVRNSERNMIYAGMARETAHQLGTPVSSLMGWAKLLREKDRNIDEVIDSIDEDISRLSKISERFSKIGSKPKLKKVNLNELVEEISNYMMERLPQNSNVSISYSDSQKIKINGDAILLSWAIENIMKNSIDAIDVLNGLLNSVISFSDKYVFLDIIDSGKGINRKEWKNIFKPGYSSKKRGWGLGLSLAQRIVKEIHGGSIKVHSSRNGETIIRLTFPK